VTSLSKSYQTDVCCMRFFKLLAWVDHIDRNCNLALKINFEGDQYSRGESYGTHCELWSVQAQRSVSWRVGRFYLPWGQWVTRCQDRVEKTGTAGWLKGFPNEYLHFRLRDHVQIRGLMMPPCGTIHTAIQGTWDRCVMGCQVAANASETLACVKLGPVLNASFGQLNSPYCGHILFVSFCQLCWRFESIVLPYPVLSEDAVL